jgi:hypothetical protein
MKIMEKFIFISALATALLIDQNISQLISNIDGRLLELLNEITILAAVKA